jgi:hyperosmotically inducible periplasmic protein
MNSNIGFSIKVAVVMMSVSVPIVVAHAAERFTSVVGVIQVRSRPQVAASASRERMGRSDAAIKADVVRALRGDRSLRDSRIIVKSVRDGVVLLSGTAASSNDNVRALSLAANRRGVRRVFSEIEPMPDFPSVPGARPVQIPIEAGGSIQHDPAGAQDDVIRRDVQKALNDLDARENADIRVRVADGVVWLTGSVPTWQGNSSRLDAARAVTGVRSIINELRVVASNADRR